MEGSISFKSLQESHHRAHFKYDFRIGVALKSKLHDTGQQTSKLLKSFVICGLREKVRITIRL